MAPKTRNAVRVTLARLRGERYSPSHAVGLQPMPLLVGPELDLMQGRYDLFTDQLDGAHHVFVRHVALVSVTNEVARVDTRDPQLTKQSRPAT